MTIYSNYLEKHREATPYNRDTLWLQDALLQWCCVGGSVSLAGVRRNALTSLKLMAVLASTATMNHRNTRHGVRSLLRVASFVWCDSLYATATAR